MREKEALLAVLKEGDATPWEPSAKNTTTLSNAAAGKAIKSL